MIDDKAQELGRLLGQSEEYRALVRATDRMKADPECQKLLADVERLAQSMRAGCAAAGQEPEPRANRRSMTGAPDWRRPIRCISRWWRRRPISRKLMAKVNARIYDGIKKGAASPIITLG